MSIGESNYSDTMGELVIEKPSSGVIVEAIKTFPYASKGKIYFSLNGVLEPKDGREKQDYEISSREQGVAPYTTWQLSTDDSVAPLIEKDRSESTLNYMTQLDLIWGRRPRNICFDIPNRFDNFKRLYLEKLIDESHEPVMGVVYGFGDKEFNGIDFQGASFAFEKDKKLQLNPGFDEREKERYLNWFSSLTDFHSRNQSFLQQEL